MKAYFAAERKQSLLLLAVGAAAIAWSARAWGSGDALAPAALPLAAVGLLQVAGGAWGFVRAPRDSRAKALLLVTDPGAFRRDERVRMDETLSKLRRLRLVELAILATGLGAMLAFRADAFWLPFGLGACAQALVMLVAHALSAARARRYASLLARFLDPAAPIEGAIETAE